MSTYQLSTTTNRWTGKFEPRTVLASGWSAQKVLENLRNSRRSIASVNKFVLENPQHGLSHTVSYKRIKKGVWETVSSKGCITRTYFIAEQPATVATQE